MCKWCVPHPNSDRFWIHVVAQAETELFSSTGTEELTKNVGLSRSAGPTIPATQTGPLTLLRISRAAGLMSSLLRVAPSIFLQVLVSGFHSQSFGRHKGMALPVAYSPASKPSAQGPCVKTATLLPRKPSLRCSPTALQECSIVGESYKKHNS